MRLRQKQRSEATEEQLEGYLWLMRSFTEELYKELERAVDDLKEPSFHPRRPPSARAS